MTASFVYLKDGHVRCRAADEEEEEHGRDGDVNVFIGCTPEGPYLRSVWSFGWLLLSVSVEYTLHA